MKPVDIAPADLETVGRILREHAPGLEVCAFGSRVSWTARETSDLDLALMTTEPLDVARIAVLSAAFTDSDLPFRVDVVDWASTSKTFRKAIENNCATLTTAEPPRAKSEWSRASIGEIAEVVGGGTPSTKDTANFDGDVPWLTPKDLSRPHDRVVARGARNLSRAGLANSAARLVPPGSILLSTRAPIGYVAIAGTEMATNQGFRNLIVRDGVCSQFIFYWLKENTEELDRYASGTTFRELSGAALKSIRVPLPPYPEQDAIARVLGALDDKIALNRRINETLEATAQAVFEDWFIHFGPTRAKVEDRESYLGPELWSLFPDRIDGATGLPEGWTQACLSDIAVPRNRAVDPADVAGDTSYIGLEHVPRRSVALEWWESATKVASQKRRFEKGEFLFGKLNPHFHKVGIAPCNGICSTDILVIRAISEEWSTFVLSCISAGRFIDFAARTSTGSTMPRTSWKALSQYQFAMPPAALVTAYHNAVGPMLDRIVVNVRDSRRLADIRDALLPQLISGQIRIDIVADQLGVAA